MPGISLVYDFTRDSNKAKNLFPDFLKDTKDNRYFHSSYYHNHGINISSYGYEEYPITKIETDKYLILLEGKVYGSKKTVIENQLLKIANLFNYERSSAISGIKKMINSTDGDYFILILNKYNRSVFFFNDLFGRLPLYYCQTEKRFIISREIRFVSSFVGVTEFNKRSITEYLLFGYPLGEHTLFESISYLDPATLVQINPSSSTNVSYTRLQDFNFSDSDKIVDLNDKALELTEAFLEACKNRKEEHGTNILSLSGGLDSRAVAAGLKKTDTEFISTTFNDFENKATKDFNIAKKIAQKLGVPWQGFVLNKTSSKYSQEILDIKCGHNSLYMAFILEFFEQLIETFGSNLIYFTGDGGDKTLAPIHPSKKFNSINELADYIIYKQSIFRLDDISRLIGFSPDTIRSYIIERLSDYPETEFQDLYKHFVIRERAIKWLFEGEDRNRGYFWTTTPFYAVDFFKKTMQVPDEYKSKFRLYNKFLSNLSPEVISITNPAWNAPLGSLKSTLHLNAANFLSQFPIKVQKGIRSKLLMKNQTLEIDHHKLSLLRNQIDNSALISQYINLSNYDSFNTLSNTQFYRIFTLTSVIKKFAQ